MTKILTTSFKDTQKNSDREETGIIMNESGCERDNSEAKDQESNPEPRAE